MTRGRGPARRRPRAFLAPVLALLPAGCIDFENLGRRDDGGAGDGAIVVDAIATMDADRDAAAAPPDLAAPDAGTTWRPLTIPTPSVHLRGVWARTADDVYVVGEQATLLRTTDGGRSWTRQTLTAGIGALDAVTGLGDEVYACGENGVVVRSVTTGGVDSFARETTGSMANLEGLFVRAPGEAYAVGEVGVVLRREGGTWTAAAIADVGQLHDVWGDETGALWVAADSPRGAELYRSPDGRTGFAVQRSFPAPAILFGVWGSGSRDVWVATSDAWRFDGSTWHDGQTMRGDYRAVFGTHARDVYFAGQGGSIVHTIDGGKVWSVDTSGTIADLLGLAGAGGAYYAVGASSTVLRKP